MTIRIVKTFNQTKAYRNSFVEDERYHQRLIWDKCLLYDRSLYGFRFGFERPALHKLPMYFKNLVAEIESGRYNDN